MKTYQFETNLKCVACEDKVRKELEKEPLVKSFAVDLKDPNRTAIVKVDGPLAVEEISAIFRVAGFEAKAKKGFLRTLFSF